MSGNRFCEQCGAALGEGVRFCENCGHSVGGAAPVAAPGRPIGAHPLPPGGGRPRNLILAIGGGVVVLTLVALGWGRFAPLATPSPTQVPKALVTATTAATKVAMLPNLASTATRTAAPASTVASQPSQAAAMSTAAPAAATPTPRATMAATAVAQSLTIGALLGDWEIVDGPVEVVGERFRIQREPDGRVRLRMLTGLEDIPGIEDIQQFYLDVRPVGGQLAGEMVTVEDDEEIWREATSLSYVSQSGELTISNDETGDTIVATQAR
ncbi:MAG: zinc-ribbon domain-containing protein [Chloroflexota bacterium]